LIASPEDGMHLNIKGLPMGSEGNGKEVNMNKNLDIALV
jgi:hypothetical protein